MKFSLINCPQTCRELLSCLNRLCGYGVLSWLALLTASLSAEDISYTQVINQPAPLGGGTISLQQFSAQLGQLQSVTVRIDSSTALTATVTANNHGEQTDTVSAELRTSIQVHVDNGTAEIQLDGFSILDVEPSMTEVEPMIVTASVGQPFVTMAPQETWIGDGLRSLPWDLSGLTTSVSGASSTGEIDVDILTLSMTVVYTFSSPNVLIFDSTDQTFHYVETVEPVVVEFAPALTESGAWSTYYDGTDPVIGRIVQLPLQGVLGFYRVRPISENADPLDFELLAPFNFAASETCTRYSGSGSRWSKAFSAK